MNRRGFLGKVFQSAPIMAGAALLGQMAATTTPIAAKLGAAVEEFTPAESRLIQVQEVPVHPAVVDFFDGEPVYDSGLAGYGETAGQFIIRVPGQLRAVGTVLHQGSILVKYAFGEVCRLSYDAAGDYLVTTVKTLAR